MISEIHIEGFRRFRKYDVNELSRVSLLVGDNNSGKSSILEAIHILAADADPHVLGEIARARGEIVVLDEPQSYRNRTSVLPDISHLFYQHRFEVGQSFSIRDRDNSSAIAVELIPADEGHDVPRLFRDDSESADVSSIWMRIDCRHSHATIFKHEFEVRSDGLFDPFAVRRSRLDPQPAQSPILSITPDSLSSDSMAGMWNKVVEEGTEDGIVEAMQILDPQITSVVFLTRPRVSRSLDRSGILVGRSGERRRFPLGSHGEGMRRFLALSLALACTRSGILLLDEIDTGIHWTRMADMWRLVIEAARQNNTQVFATTHSYDCIKGLAWVCDNYPDLAEYVSLQSIKPELDESVAMPGERLPFAIGQEIEVR